MGFAPADVWGMSLWEFRAAQAGWIKANSADDGKSQPPTPEEHDEMIAKHA